MLIFSQEYLSTPIFSPDWGADEELLLISGLITFGLGNWLEVAGYIGTRTKEECEKHYYEVFLGVPLEDGTGGSIHKETAELDAKDESQEKAVTTSQEGKRKREFMPVCFRLCGLNMSRLASDLLSPWTQNSLLTQMSGRSGKRRG